MTRKTTSSLSKALKKLSPKLEALEKLSKNNKVIKAKLAAHRRRIARENRAFEKLTPAQKRVAIAHDVLAQIAAQKFIPENGIWLADARNGNEELFSLKDVKENKELRDVINNTEACRGCALGGIFMCAIKRIDALKVNDLTSVKNAKKNEEVYGVNLDGELRYNKAPELKDILKYFSRNKLFTKHQLRLIELAFESGGGGVDVNLESPQELLAQRFFNLRDSEISDSTERMRLIMENIIVNKGTFVPSQKPVLKTMYVTPGFDIAA